MAKCEAIFFDLDDTLIEWASVHKPAINYGAGRLTSISYNINTQDVADAMTTIISEARDSLNRGQLSIDDVSDRITRTLTRLGADESSARRVIDDYIDFALNNVRAFDDSYLIPQLANVYRLGVITNGPSAIQSKKLRHAGLAQFFDAIICSSDYGVCKPEPGIFEIACRSMGVNPCACRMVGNNFAKDAAGALDFGIRGIWLNRDGMEIPTAGRSIETITSLIELPKFL